MTRNREASPEVMENEMRSPESGSTADRAGPTASPCFAFSERYTKGVNLGRPMTTNAHAWGNPPRGQGIQTGNTRKWNQDGSNATHT